MKRVVIVVPDAPVNLNSVGGAFDILSRANACWQQGGRQPAIDLYIAGYMRELKSHQQYFAIHPVDIRSVPPADLVIIPSLLEQHEEAVTNNAALLDWITQQYKHGAEVASICSGAFLLAATGLLDGRNCSIHWNKTAAFRRMFPAVQVTADTIITDEHGIYTNGGAYSFLNLIIYLVEKLFDRDTAVLCAKIFQVDIERVSQAPFAIFQPQGDHGDELIAEAQRYIAQHLEDRISFEALASSLAISRRNFDRRFVKATGNTPIEYQQRIKVEVAKKALEHGRKTIYEIMADVGYADDKAFREVFKRMTGLSPLDYRRRYYRERQAVPVV